MAIHGESSLNSVEGEGLWWWGQDGVLEVGVWTRPRLKDDRMDRCKDCVQECSVTGVKTSVIMFPANSMTSGSTLKESVVPTLA